MKKNNHQEQSKIEIFTHFMKDLRLTFSLIRDYINGDYRDLSRRTYITLGVAFLYVISPIGIMIGMIPIIGWIDDIVIIVLCITLMQDDLEKYRTFKAERLDHNDK